MKNLFFSIVYVLGSVSICFCQKVETSKVPSDILKKFNTAFPKAEKSTWHLDADSGYTTIFFVGEKRCVQKYDKKYSLVESDRTLDFNGLPVVIKNNVTKNYSEYKAESVTEFNMKDSITYEIFLVKDKESYILKFSPEGKLRNKAEKKILR